MRWLLVLSLAACASDVGSAPEPEPAIDLRQGPTDSGDDGLPDVDRPVTQPVWTPAEVEQAIARALVEGLPDPWRMQEAYLDVLSNGDGACPGHATYIDDTHLYGCEATTGWFYSGVSEYHQRDVTDEDGRWEGIEALGDFLFRSPSGDEMEVGGHARWRRYRDDSGNLTRMTTEHSGSWKWEGHEGWLTDTVSGLYTMDLQRGDAGGRITLDGAAQVWSEELFFEQLTLEEGDCAWAPVGALRVRDPSGGWYRVDFGASCGPCGEATFAGEPAGSVCVDLSEVPARLDEQLRELR